MTPWKVIALKLLLWLLNTAPSWIRHIATWLITTAQAILP